MLLASKKRQRLKLRATPFPPAWREILERRFPLFACLPSEDQKELQEHIQVFLAEKQFEGCDGLAITDEIRVAIAAQACLLLLHRETDYYPELTSILVYPGTYYSRLEDRADADSGGVAGQSWTRGPVILSWDAVRGGASSMLDGHNLVFHEFAHQLDQEDGRADGVPLLGAKTTVPERLSRYASWAKILAEEYKQLNRDLEENRETVMDDYGATNPAEFFAVATECFFEKPGQLKARHPQLYEQLKRFYRQDPVQWRGPATEGV